MLTLTHNPRQVTQSSVPDIGDDLIAAEREGFFAGMPADRLMAIFELLRHGEMNIQQAANLCGIPAMELLRLLDSLPVPELQALARKTDKP